MNDQSGCVCACDLQRPQSPCVSVSVCVHILAGLPVLPACSMRRHTLGGWVVPKSTRVEERHRDIDLSMCVYVALVRGKEEGGGEEQKDEASREREEEGEEANLLSVCESSCVGRPAHQQ